MKILQLGWIDFSREQRDKVMKILHNLAQKTALDELGIGAIRDGFADIFFPGTSTIQTRAKYFVLIPYIFREIITGKNIKKGSMQDLIEQRELELIQDLKDNSGDDLRGIIGQDSGINLKRKPSSVYWSGIRSWKIFDPPEEHLKNFSLNQYCMFVENHHSKREQGKLSGKKVEDDEDALNDDPAYMIIGLSFFDFPENIPDSLDQSTIKLTYGEAVFLQKKIIASHSESLLAHFLVQDNWYLLPKDNLSFQDLLDLSGFKDAEMARKIQLASWFATFNKIINVRFNWLLREGMNRESYDRKWQESLVQVNNLGDNHLEEIFTLLKLTRESENKTKQFLNLVYESLKTGDFDTADRLIRKREESLKRSRSKFKNIQQLNLEHNIGIEELDYRLPIALQLLSDIHHGLRM
ncbi:DUF6361 family protein [Sphaerochaeta globosa]|uniref:Uncharacterized protein n=1 Tax=Sphaerochaeta globosa (strain ATCC BAA-1886 / DSM 22777 / Buddy) TaxID=158189 RepID=F0RRF0_SPHGB|nr:DUF6361 family protein [Sphaerochaeta globosa]ADY14202.1 hypothetical protein SpiBuddy_2388 [Sphaerochaeta globosa str. Buddy]